MSLEHTFPPVNIKDKLVEEVKKFGFEIAGDKEVNFQKWSERWQCYINIEEDDLENLRDGDKVLAVICQNQKQSEVLVSFVFVELPKDGCCPK